MKKHVIAILASAAFMFSLELQAQYPKLGPEHKKLNVWVGNWTYEKETQATPLGPGGKSSGKMSGKPVLGGFFVEVNGERTGSTDTFSWFEIQGYDAMQKKYTWTGWGSDGDINSGTYTFDGKTMNYLGTVLLGEKRYKIRGTIVLSADSIGMVEDREFSVDGQTWISYFRIRYAKIR